MCVCGACVSGRVEMGLVCRLKLCEYAEGAIYWSLSLAVNCHTVCLASKNDTCFREWVRLILTGVALPPSYDSAGVE